MTERLYYTDAYLAEFDALVVDVRPVGDRAGVLLDRTAFYPTSGGQPFDTGVLGGARVLDVVDREDGDILHVIDGDAPRGRVPARIDWPRRFDHMQQHTGQHVLSAAFDRLLDVPTVSFHLGGVGSTIDLAREVTRAELSRAEDAANQIVWEDRPVTVRFVDAEEAASLALRKEPARTGRLRIIEVEGFDVSACGGTHVGRTGAIGIVAIASWERFRGGTRIDFRCGSRALGSHRALRDLVAAATQSMSVAAEDLPRGIERLQSENKELKRQARDLEARLGRYEADALAAAAEVIGPFHIVIGSLPDRDLNGLKSVAQALVSRPAHAAILCSTGEPASIVIARAADVTLDAAGLLKQLLARFGGKGGGRPELAQGGGLAAPPERILAAARSLLA